MRRVVVASLVGLVALTVAAPAAAKSGEKPQETFSSQFNTEWILQVQGFRTPKVFYRIANSQDIVVVYDGGGPAESLEAIRQIEGTVWGLEQVRFDRLVIQNGNQPPVVVSNGELEATIGPRQPGFNAASLRDVVLVRAAGEASFAVFDELLQLLKVILAVIGVTALLATLAFGLACFLGTRRRVPDESEDRLIA